MSRKVLLVEPNYKNKYPPIGLMKLATYHRQLGDEVIFYKGEFREFIVQGIYEEVVEKLYNIDNRVEWFRLKDRIKQFIMRGFYDDLDFLASQSESNLVSQNLIYYKDYYKKKIYLDDPKWDRVCISTLFTFHWKKTIETINSFKQLCKYPNQVFIGGVAASVLPIEIEEATGIKPWIGLLNTPRILDDNEIVIDNLPLDYSILEEVDYDYPENNGYYGYMTRGCVNKCSFCLVPTIEPTYCEYIGIQGQIDYVRNRFGEKRNLLLLDNNVLASERFNQIIDEIKLSGFGKKEMFMEPNKYEIAIKAIQDDYNSRAYIKSIIKLYKQLMTKLPIEDQSKTYELLKQYNLLDEVTATKANILDTYDYFKPLFDKKYIMQKPKVRHVDFNQGLDARLLTDDKMKKLSEIPINPLRVAFDTWGMKNIYEKAIRTAVKYNIKSMSNYLLYNYKDKPVDLYYRLKLNIDLCEELGVTIYSFPMKYHPIDDPEYFADRSYIGEHWNRKYIRAVQAILNSTKGKIGKGKDFFEEAFGRNEEEFEKLLYMPETFIIYRMYYKNNGITDEWWNKFRRLSPEQLTIAKHIIHSNDFQNVKEQELEAKIQDVLYYYSIRREDAEKEMLVTSNMK
ncbi:hypothetical protein F8154_08775 [Alkaliphilus pronyensis]|uniref:Radical SAM protein n=1 Tax=Alkaliphilus pronyensis TaxID=1482732 RepID=A0A6I0F148_9FIRM|nr:hypothetical protein [Alkaliphilus pronyensis]KAB3534494.1 hypothetical protein F8154_08775 [Alkaliphilus pronyensis]